MLRWQQLATSERRTAWQLFRRGFLWRKEPHWVSGRKPDFLTFGRGSMWVEVKALDAPASTALLGFAHTELKRRFDKSDIHCAVYANVAEGFDQRTAKRAMHTLEVAINDGLDRSRKTFIGIPAGDVDNSTVVIDWTDDSGTDVRMYSPRSRKGSYGCPLSGGPSNWIGDISITDGSTQTKIPAFKLLSETDCCLLTFRIIPKAVGYGLYGVGSARATNDTTVVKIRKRVGDAAVQIRNAQTFRQHPGVVVIYNDHLGGDQFDLMRACLGDLTVPIDLATKKAGSMHYGLNGILNNRKNTSVSAVTYRSRLFSDISLINPYASIAVNPRWLLGSIYAVELDGLVRCILTD